jgi:hypothetical protein
MTNVQPILRNLQLGVFSQRSVKFFSVVALCILCVACSQQKWPEWYTPPGTGWRTFDRLDFYGMASNKDGNLAEQLIIRSTLIPARNETILTPPDLEVDAYRHNSKRPERYSVWLHKKIVFRGSYHPSNHPIRVYDARDDSEANFRPLDISPE